MDGIYGSGCEVVQEGVKNEVVRIDVEKRKKDEKGYRWSKKKQKRIYNREVRVDKSRGRGRRKPRPSGREEGEPDDQPKTHHFPTSAK